MTERRACKGGITREAKMGCEAAQECTVCGQKVRHDLTDHPFFGFAASGCMAGEDLPAGTACLPGSSEEQAC